MTAQTLAKRGMANRSPAVKAILFREIIAWQSPGLFALFVSRERNWRFGLERRLHELFADLLG
jgi:hypothetical protein